MGKKSAGILPYRIRDGKIEFFIVHQGGPLWEHKDIGGWSIAKGEFTDEEPIVAARREFFEETGQEPPVGEYIELSPCKLKSGKVVYSFAVNGEPDTNIISNLFTMEYPPKSGRMQSFPEVDRAGWFDGDTTKLKLNPYMAGMITEITAIIAG